MNKKNILFRKKLEFYYNKNFNNQRNHDEIARYIKEKAISMWKKPFE